jgi:hypothetical protein
MYRVIESVIHQVADSNSNPSPYNNTFSYINSRCISPTINRNTINKISSATTTISSDDRGDLITSDIMGNDLIESMKNEVKKGFNNIFYNIKNYTYDYRVADLNDLEKLNFLRNSLISFDGLNKVLNSFLRYNFVSTNSYFYTTDKKFKMGFFVKKDSTPIYRNGIFSD